MAPVNWYAAPHPIFKGGQAAVPPLFFLLLSDNGDEAVIFY